MCGNKEGERDRGRGERGEMEVERGRMRRKRIMVDPVRESSVRLSTKRVMIRKSRQCLLRQ